MKPIGIKARRSDETFGITRKSFVHGPIFIGKRQVRSPKVYVRDSGLLHALLNLPTQRDLENHPKAGASWEGFIIDQILQQLEARPDECYFWRTHTGAELDLLVVRGRRRHGFEVKRTTAPAITPSMRSALKDLGLASLTVIHAGEHSFALEALLGACKAVRMHRGPVAGYTGRASRARRRSINALPGIRPN